MTGLDSLVLPILLSAVAMFAASSVIHMGPFWHKSDYPRIPKEDEVRAALRPLAIPPGDYMLPRSSGHAEMSSPEFTKKLQEGPVWVVTVLPNGRFGMGQSLALWFVYGLVVSFFTAYVTGRALGPGAHYLEAFRFAGVTSFIGYSLALWQMSIWYKRAWSAAFKATFDGLIYALLTAGVFGWLWPR